MSIWHMILNNRWADDPAIDRSMPNEANDIRVIPHHDSGMWIRINMRHQVKNRMTGDHPSPCFYSDIVALCDGQIGIDIQMHIH